MPLPNFIIAGAPKAGTTSLYDLLGQHPEVGLSYIKEPGYFSDGWPKWARTLAEYEQLFTGCEDKIAIGEASPCYLYDPNSAKCIKKILGKSARIIIALRHPVKRAYSHWSHEHYRYARDPLSFDEALEQEAERAKSPETLNKSYYFHGMYRYVWGSQYAEKVKAYIDTFGKDRVAVVVFEDLARDHNSIFAELCEFLQIDAGIESSAVHSNVATEPRVQFVSKMISCVNRCEQFQSVYHGLPPGLRKLVYKSSSAIFWKMQKRRMATVRPGDDSTLDELLAVFLADIHRLEDLLDRDLSIWYGAG